MMRKTFQVPLQTFFRDLLKDWVAKGSGGGVITDLLPHLERDILNQSKSPQTQALLEMFEEKPDPELESDSEKKTDDSKQVVSFFGRSVDLSAGLGPDQFQ